MKEEIIIFRNYVTLFGYFRKQNMYAVRSIHDVIMWTVHTTLSLTLAYGLSRQLGGSVNVSNKLLYKNQTVHCFKSALSPTVIPFVY